MFVLADFTSKGRDWVLLPLYDPGQFVGILHEGDYEQAHKEKNTMRLGQRRRKREGKKNMELLCCVCACVVISYGHIGFAKRPSSRLPCM